MRKTGSILLAWLLLSKTLLLAQVSLNVSVDKRKVALGDSIRLSIEISGGGNISSPHLPDLTAFSAYSSGRSQSYSFVNGRKSSSITHNYLLNPKNVGQFTIGPVSVVADGKTYQSQPIGIEVVPPSSSAPAPPAARGTTPAPKDTPGAFVRMVLNKKRAYVNEEVVLSFRFYYRVQLLSSPGYNPPKMTGFLFEDLPPPRNFTEVVNGLNYHVGEVNTALFPTAAGKMAIPPAELRIRVLDPRARDPFGDDFFSQFFQSRMGREITLRTDPVVLQVSSLPREGKPKDFSGGVGDFKISAGVDKKEGKVGDPITLTVSLKGEGNIKSLGDPLFPDFKGFRKYDTASSLNIDKSRGKVEGSKDYKIILVPQLSGIQKIDPIQFNFFHLPSRKYKTITTRSFSLDVKPGAAQQGPSVPFTFKTPEIKKLQEEIRYIKAQALPSVSFTWVHESKAFLWLNLIPVLGVLLFAAVRWRQVILTRNPQKRRYLGALSQARRELGGAGKLLRTHDLEGASEKVFAALRNYVSDKMVRSRTGTSLRDVEEFLRSCNLPPEVLADFKHLWAECEKIRYAPSQSRSGDLSRMLEETGRLLTRMENSLKKISYEKTFKNSLLLWVVCFSLGFSLGTLSLLSQDSRGERFKEANQLYNEGKIKQAISQYKFIKDESNFLNPVLEYNLGNCAYQLGRRGEALAHWIRAWRMSPRDSDIRHNLAMVSRMTGDPFFPDFFLLRWAKLTLYFLNLNECSVLWLLVLWVSCIFWMWALLRGALILRSGETSSGSSVFHSLAVHSVLVLVLLSAGSLWLTRLSMEALERTAVVTTPEVEVRSGPGKHFVVGSTVPEGRRVSVLRRASDSNWIEIGVPQKGIKGWVAAASITEI